MHGSHSSVRTKFKRTGQCWSTYHTSCTPQINPIVEAIGENQLRHPQLPWLSKYSRLVSLEERLSEVKNPKILFIFIYPVFPFGDFYDLFL